MHVGVQALIFVPTPELALQVTWMEVGGVFFMGNAYIVK